MVLPLIPIAIGAVSALTAAFGAKKGYDAKKSLDRAKSDLDDAIDEFNEVQEKVEHKKEVTNTALRELGELRLQTDAGPLKSFVELASSVHNVSHKAIKSGALQVESDAPTFEDMRISAYQATDLLKDGVTAIPVGVLTGIGAAGTVSMLGAASTGTMISTLSGVAASNATLAWLGGGSLAAGGWGVAGGTAVLGGVVLGPAIAVMGLAAASKMNKQTTEVREKEAEYQVATEQLESALTALDAICARTAEVGEAIHSVTARFNPILKKFTQLIRTKNSLRAKLEEDSNQRKFEDAQRPWYVRLWKWLTLQKIDYSFPDPLSFDNFDSGEQELYALTSSFAYTLYALLKVPVLDEQGELNEGAIRCLDEANTLLISKA